MKSLNYNDLFFNLMQLPVSVVSGILIGSEYSLGLGLVVCFAMFLLYGIIIELRNIRINQESEK